MAVSTRVDPCKQVTEVRISGNTIFLFEDGITLSGGDLSKYLRLLRRLVETEFPEELL